MPAANRKRALEREMKTTAKTEPTTNRPKATDTLVNIGEQVLLYRGGDDKPTLSAVARLMNRASGLLRIGDVDERLEVENKATIALAQKLRLIG
jgi:hypothetical protein